MKLHAQDHSINGFKTRIYSAGEESSTAVVFVHGNPGPSDDWHYSMERVADLAYVIAPDMPGYGHSSRDLSFNMTVDGYAAHLNAIVELKQLQKVHLVLHDFGGGWGLGWAMNNPDKVASICVVNCGVFRNYSWHWLAKIWRTPLLGELFQLTSTKAAFKHALNAQNPRPVPDHFVDRVWSYSDWAHRKAVLKLYRSTSAADINEATDLVIAALKPRAIPGLVIWGESDPYLNVRYAELQKEYMNCNIELMRNCGHWPMVDEPEQFTNILTTYLKRVLNVG